MGKNIKVIAQAFYGNRTATEVNTDNIDAFILGYLDYSLPIKEKIDRTVIKIPDTDVVIIYNSIEEDKARNLEHSLILAEIPELNIALYSRCIACRIDADGNLDSAQREDYQIVKKYFAE